MIRCFILVMSMVVLAACSTTPVLDPKVQNAPPVSVPTIAPLALNNVQFKVYNTADLKALLANNPNKDLVIIGLDPTNFQNMNLNLNDIKRYITQQKAVIVMLKDVVSQESNVLPSADNPKTK